MSSNVFREFPKLWRRESQATRAPLSDEDIRLEHEKRMAMVKEVRVVVKTQWFKDYCEWLDNEIEKNAPDPSLGSDVAACFTFKREGLMVARRRLDTMVKLAEERLSDGS